jgi:ubiquinone/menaquinone biosynthesis C-methylase UbiE
MPPVFWTGKLSLPMKFVVNFNNLFAWITGNARDTAAMKQRMKLGYEGARSDDVTRYDELGLRHYTKIATELLKGADLRGKEVLDVGCGTGILSLLALQQGAAKIVCGDLSEYMLNQCLTKATNQGYTPDRLVTRQVDAESLPYEERSFDVVISGMLLGLVPHQQKVINEMTRVLRPGGMIAFSTHAPDCWWETSDATFKAVPKRYVLGYRVEYWPRNEVHIQRMLKHAKLVDIRIRKLFWQDHFETGGKAYDFFTAVSASWWKAKFPPDKIGGISKRIRNYFERNKVAQITHDIILAYAHKP